MQKRNSILLMSHDAEFCEYLHRALSLRQWHLSLANGRTELFRKLDDLRPNVLLIDVPDGTSEYQEAWLRAELKFLAGHFSADCLPQKIAVLSSNDCLQAADFEEIVAVFPRGASVGVLQDFFQKAQLSYAEPTLYFLDPVRMKAVFPNGQSANLTPTEYQLLSLFDLTLDQKASRQLILDSVWGTRKVGSKTINVHFNHLRQKLKMGGLDVKYCGENLFRLEKSKEYQSEI